MAETLIFESNQDEIDFYRSKLERSYRKRDVKGVNGTAMSMIAAVFEMILEVLGPDEGRRCISGMTEAAMDQLIDQRVFVGCDESSVN